MAVVALIVLASASIAALVAWLIQPTLRVSHIALPVKDLPDELEGFKIVQLTDLHYDLPRKPTMTEELLEEIVQVRFVLSSMLY